MPKVETVNVTLTLPIKLVKWIDGKANAEFEGNRSQAARKILREAKTAEEAKGKIANETITA